MTENAGDVRLAQSRGVVFKGEVILLLVDAKAAQAVSVGEFAEAAELFEAQRRLQFVRDFEECHEESIREKERRGEKLWMRSPLVLEAGCDRKAVIIRRAPAGVRLTRIGPRGI